MKLTRDTVDDSSAVKTITVITLIYLPASFISVGSAVPTFLKLHRRSHANHASLGTLWNELLQLRRFLGIGHVAPDLDIYRCSVRSHDHNLYRLETICVLPEKEKRGSSKIGGPRLSLYWTYVLDTLLLSSRPSLCDTTM